MMKTKKILIIDDDDRNIFALESVLKAKQFDCLSATGAIQALEVLQKEKEISVALVDMMMPDMDGYELMGLLRKMPLLSHLRLVAVTAQAMVGDKEKCLAAGADAYLSKPVDIDELLDVLSEQLKGHK